jgi:ATP-binding cassette subfamily B (MDR/TAP) protein 10
LLTGESAGYTGRFFETLIGVRKQPLGDLLAKLCLVYVLEPFFTVLFVTNMIQIWEKVMKELRFRVFERLLIQKVGFPLLFLTGF